MHPNNERRRIGQSIVCATTTLRRIVIEEVEKIELQSTSTPPYSPDVWHRSKVARFRPPCKSCPSPVMLTRPEQDTSRDRRRARATSSTCARHTSHMKVESSGDHEASAQFVRGALSSSVPHTAVLGPRRGAVKPATVRWPLAATCRPPWDRGGCGAQLGGSPPQGTCRRLEKQTVWKRSKTLPETFSLRGMEYHAEMCSAGKASETCLSGYVPCVAATRPRQRLVMPP